MLGHSGFSHDSIRPTWEVALSGAPRDRWNIEIGTDRTFLAVTPRAIDRGIYSQRFFAGTAYWFDSRTSLTLAFDRRRWSDANYSVQGEGALSRNLIYGKAFNLDAGVITHHQAFHRDMLAVSGFFTPDHYGRYDGFLKTNGEARKWLIWELRGEGGSQQITSGADFRPNWAVTARMSGRLHRALWLYASYERKNYSLLSRDGWYQGFTVSLTVLPPRK